MTLRRQLVAVTLILSVLGIVGCGRDRGLPRPATSTATVRVFAAASLTDVFATIGRQFEAGRPGVEVELNFAGSSTLREQLLAGAPGDVFASAAPDDMDRLVAAGVADAPVVFARNQMEIAVSPASREKVTALGDFARADLLLGLCAATVPCGRLARQVLSNARVTADIDTEEPDVRSLLTKIESGDLDAGIVYRTDVRASGSTIIGVPIDPERNVITGYPVAVLHGASGPAADFVAYLRSSEARAALVEAGFEIP